MTNYPYTQADQTPELDKLANDAAEIREWLKDITPGNPEGDEARANLARIEARVQEITTGIVNPELMSERIHEGINVTLVTLASARRALDQAKAEIARMDNELKQNKDYRNYQDQISVDKDVITQCEDAIRQAAVEFYKLTGSKTVNEAVKVKEETEILVTYDQQNAFSWALDKMPSLLILDTEKFLAYAKAVAGLPMALDWVKIETIIKPKGQIGSKLDAWLPQETGEELLF